MRSPAFTTTWSILRLVMGLVIVAAVVTQLVASVATTVELGRDLGTVIANFFSFFTILSNVLAASVLLWAGIDARRRDRTAVESPALATALACATTAMIITGIVYNLLLRGITLPQGSEPVPWSNEVLHLIGPLFLLLDLLFGPRRRDLPWRSVLVVLAFPLVWVTYTLLRGPLVTNPATGDPWWYPYPFLNPNNPGGWPSVLVYIAGISIAFVAVGAFTVWIGRRRAAAAESVTITS
ncbi:Pr6Pr family membrane protein [Microbacterium sp. PA5]|uniref:Pr6Pr family membrane protein n=1 Tax=Microbacterium sp. PA5 TaxID=3416654 RepID=UPI003CE8B418